MGNLATPEALIARWDELCRDPSLRNLPYKIELNAWGKEVWIVGQEGTIRYFTSTGEQPKSAFPVAISLPPPVK